MDGNIHGEGIRHVATMAFGLESGVAANSEISVQIERTGHLLLRSQTSEQHVTNKDLL